MFSQCALGLHRGVRGGVHTPAAMSVSVQIWCHRLAVAAAEGSRRSRRWLKHILAAGLVNQGPSEKPQQPPSVLVPHELSTGFGALPSEGAVGSVQPSDLLRHDLPFFSFPPSLKCSPARYPSRGRIARRR